MEMRKLSLILLLLLLPSLSQAAAPTRTYSYVAHTTIDPTQNNTNENSLYSYLQAGVDVYASGSITNDAIASAAGISYSKLNLIGSILNSDISASAAIAYTKLNLTGSIVNADIKSTAAIVGSKLNLTSPGAIGSTSANTGAFSTLKVGTTHQGDVLYDNGTTLVRLTPGTSGQVFKTNGVAANPSWTDTGSTTSFSARIVNPQTTSVTTPLNVDFDGEDFDAGNNYSHPNFTAPITGKYLFTVTLESTASATTPTVGLYIYKNGANYSFLDVRTLSTTTGFLGGTIIISLTAGDTITPYITRIAGAGDTATGAGTVDSRFTGMLVL